MISINNINNKILPTCINKKASENKKPWLALALLTLASGVQASNMDLKECNLAAVVNNGHGFLQFDCGKTASGAYGFYPFTRFDGQLSPSASVLNSIAAQLAPFEFTAAFEPGPAPWEGFEVTTTLAQPSCQIIQKIPGVWCMNKVLHSTLPASSVSLLHPGSVGGSFLSGISSVGISSIPKADYAWQLWNVNGAILDETRLPSFYECISTPEKCVIAELRLPQEKVKAAWEFMARSQSATFEQIGKCYENAIVPSITEQCSTNNSLITKESTNTINPNFQALGNNCIDFMRTVLNETGELEAYDQILRSRISKKNWSWDRITGLAWHYFMLRTEETSFETPS